MARARRLTAALEEEIVGRYQAGDSTAALGKTFGFASRTIRSVLHTHEVALRPRSDISAGGWQRIVSRYRAGEGAYRLAKEYGVSSTSIYRHLEMCRVRRRTNSQAQAKYTCRHRYFAAIDSEAKAYWLGFLAADGCVKDCGDLTVSLAERDRSHLERMAEALGSDRPLRTTCDNGRPMVCLTIRSHRLCADLTRHGVTPRKTHTLCWPELPSVWVRHFVRGYVDGDGGFYFRACAYPGGHHSFGVTGNEAFIGAMQSYLMVRSRLRQTKLTYRRGGVRIATMNYGGRQQVARIACLLYRNATVFLARKREPVSDLIL